MKRFLILLLASCAGTTTANDHINPEVPLWYTRPSGSLDVVFRRTLTVPSRKLGEEYERGRPEIDPVRMRVFVGSSDRGLYALRAGDGSTLWRFETLSSVACEPYYDRELDVVFFGSQDGALYALRASDGGLLFRYDTGAEILRKPIRNGETLYFANAQDQLFAIHRRTGATKWKTGRQPAAGMEVAGHAGPAYFDGRVFFAFSDGYVSAYDAKDGTEKWAPVDLTAEAEQAKGTTEMSKQLDVDTTPIVTDVGGRAAVLAASYAGGIFALDAKTGQRIWGNTEASGATDIFLWEESEHYGPEEPDEGVRQKIPARNMLVASSANTGLWGIEVANGRPIWRDKLPEGGITAPAQVGGAILVGTTKYGLFLVAPRNGRVIDGVDVGTGFAQHPAAYGSKAYVLSNGGTLVGLNVDAPRMEEKRAFSIW